MNSMPSVREMRRAFLAGDASYDGIFITGVRTTGIFCRPSCPSRKPRPENVEFFQTSREAAFSGYRPCKRCRPRRLSQAFLRIKEGATVSDAMSEAGFNSESGFRSAFEKVFGAAPTASKEDQAIYLDWLETPLGPLVAGATNKAVCLIEFSDRRMFEAQIETLRRRFGAALAPGSNRVLRTVRSQLNEYFTGQRQNFDLPLDYRGTPFQERVWTTLLEIPYGETWSYRDLAGRTGDPKACRAVGTANGMNRIAIVIPCHRVVNADGALGGYGGGVWRKQFLLDLERGQRRLAE